MNRHVVDVDLLRERASATPASLGTSARQGSRLQASRPPIATEAIASLGPPAFGRRAEALREAQLWFAHAVMTPESAAAAVTADDASQVLTSGPRLHALDRLEIYRRAYHARLIECLADDYSVLRHALGNDAFENFCRGFIACHPSEGPNLNFFGKGMDRFCRAEAPSPFPLRHFAADLASLEWAIVEVIHAPSSEPLTLDALRDIPMAAWATARLVPNSAFRLLRFDSPVNAYFQAVREGKHPPIPEADPSATVVYRSGATVWRMDLTVPMFEVLSALAAGHTLVTSLARAEGSFCGLDEQEVAKQVLGWFREWVASGLFVRVEVAVPESTGRGCETERSEDQEV